MKFLMTIDYHLINVNFIKDIRMIENDEFSNIKWQILARIDNTLYCLSSFDNPQVALREITRLYDELNDYRISFD